MNTIQKLHATGAGLWKDTYGTSSSDEHCRAVVAERCGDLALRIDVTSHVMFAAAWVDSGCPILEADDVYFAAMAQTKTTADAGEELCVPWRAFAVRIPPGLLVSREGAVYTTATCAQFDGLREYADDPPRSMTYFAIHSDEGSTLFEWEPTTLDRLLFQAPVDHSDDDNPLTQVMRGLVEAEDDSDGEIRRMVRRAVTGLLYTLQHTTNWTRGSTFSRAGRGKGREPPTHRAIIIGRPLNVDVRQAVREAATSGRAAPAVQTLVRGHIKRQAVGPAGSGRKVIWVEPYWRGPEDAPILARPHRVGRRG